MGAAASSGEEYWEQTRVFMRVWRGILCALLVALFFYSPAIRYLDTYDLNCAAPGTLTSELWSWEFILQALYGFFLIPLLWIAGEMITEWYNWRPYMWFLIWNAITLMWMVSTGIYLSVEASHANTVNSPGNAFNDFRACGVFGSVSTWTDYCKLTGPYTPGVLESELGINDPKMFQLVMHWLFVVMAGISMIYVPTTYKSSQLEMGKTLDVPSPGNSEPLLPEDEQEEEEPTSSASSIGRRASASSNRHKRQHIRKARGMFRQ